MPTKSRTTRKAASRKRAASRAARPAPAPAPARAARPKRKKPETLRLRMVIPSLTVNDLARSIRFYVDGLGFIIRDRWEKDGKPGGVMLRAGACELMLTQDDFAKGRDRVKGVGHRIWLSTVQNVDERAARAKANGLTLDHDAKDLPFGSRAFAATDPDGFKVTVANDGG